MAKIGDSRGLNAAPCRGGSRNKVVLSFKVAYRQIQGKAPLE